MTAVFRFIANIPWFLPFVLAVGLGYMGFQERTTAEVVPLDNQKLSLETDIQKVREEIERVKKFEAEKDQLYKEEGELDKAFKAAKAQFPPTIDLPDLMKSFEDMARELDVKISQFTPDLSVKRELLSSSRVSLRITGTYIQGMQYLNALSKMIRVINVESVKFGSPNADTAGQILEIEFNMVTFFVGDA